MGEPNEPMSKETQDITPGSEASPPQTKPFDPTEPEERNWLVSEVRRQIVRRYGSEYKRRCATSAVCMLNALRQMGINSYRIAAGGVDETDKARAVTGNVPRNRYRGEYTGTGKSHYHVWIVSDAGEKIDCSELPLDYNQSFLWEPYELVAELAYNEFGATTQRVQVEVDRTHKMVEPTPADRGKDLAVSESQADQLR